MTFSTTDQATILAALRYWQNDLDHIDPDELKGYGHFTNDNPLNAEQIDDLCERINFSNQFGDTYQVIALSTGHLTEQDRDRLRKTCNDQDNNMVLCRDTGFFIKLYEELSPEDLPSWYSETLKRLILAIHRQGYRMIEFDSDAPVLDAFPVYEW